MSLPVSRQEEFTKFAISLAHLARRETMACFRRELTIETKGQAGFDPVTHADKAAERVLRQEIERVYPDHGILGEEEGEKKNLNPYRWVIDPIDGTRAFINGVASWTTLIALEYEDAPAIGLIDQPVTDDLWVGLHRKSTILISKGQERICTTRQAALLATARISTTDPLAGEYFSGAEAARFENLASQAQFARYGLDGYGYGILAMGGLDLIIETGLAHYDAAALIPVVTGAGGEICDWAGCDIDEYWALPPAAAMTQTGDESGHNSGRKPGQKLVKKSKHGTGGQMIACANKALRDEVLLSLSPLSAKAYSD